MGRAKFEEIFARQNNQEVTRFLRSLCIAAGDRLDLLTGGIRGGETGRERCYTRGRGNYFVTNWKIIFHREENWPQRGTWG